MATKSTSAKARGSDLMNNRYSEEDLEKLLAAGDADGITLVEFAAGPLPDPWLRRGVWQVERRQLAGLIDRLTNLDHVPYFRVFPKGIPRPDMFEVMFETAPPPHR